MKPKISIKFYDYGWLACMALRRIDGRRYAFSIPTAKRESLCARKVIMVKVRLLSAASGDKSASIRARAKSKIKIKWELL